FNLICKNCKDYKLQFERVFSVPGEAAMLNTTLVAMDVFNFTTEPYNVTWYDPRTGQELSNQTGRVVVRGETLWLLSVQLEDAGEYESIVRTPSRCYRQQTKLVVEKPPAGQCGRPRQAGQVVTISVNGFLSCPLKDYISKLKDYNASYSMKWYKGCELIEDRRGRFTYLSMAQLKVEKVELEDSGNYTCTLTFDLGGVTASVSETINTTIKETYYMRPIVHKPENITIKVEKGSRFNQSCLMFVPCVGEPSISISWADKNDFIESVPENRVYTVDGRSWRQESPSRGLWKEVLLVFSEVREEDFYKNYTCMVFSARGTPQCFFTLLPPDPQIALTIGLVLGSATVLFITSVVLFYLFKVDIVLCFRRTFPVFYTNTDSDGKLYDAYVAYPRQFGVGSGVETETFVFHMLPQVLEKTCGYKLFITGRDCLPGQAIVNAVEENMQASRRLLLIYTASTFTCRRQNSSFSNNNNNNITKSDGDGGNSDGSDSVDGGDGGCVNAGQQFECEMAMYRMLLEGSLKVVLVELEPISPAQLALFPESVRHLRKRHGAVCWWKSQDRRTPRRKSEDEEKRGTRDAELPPPPSLSPSSRFWKEMRYHMPVRGKRAMYPEKTALLTLSHGSRIS
uniref:Zmp:0000000936 n=1 Tax=Myripristis murdjan TaxID=586833 RepID=A0A668AJF0_9TELE